MRSEKLATDGRKAAHSVLRFCFCFDFDEKSSTNLMLWTNGPPPRVPSGGITSSDWKNRVSPNEELRLPRGGIGFSSTRSIDPCGRRCSSSPSENTGKHKKRAVPQVRMRISEIPGRVEPRRIGKTEFPKTKSCACQGAGLASPHRYLMIRHVLRQARQAKFIYRKAESNRRLPVSA